MDDAGNLLIRRYGKSNVYIKSATSAASEETAIGADVLKAPNQCLEIEKVYKVSWRELFLLTSQCLTFNMSPHPFASYSRSST